LFAIAYKESTGSDMRGGIMDRLVIHPNTQHIALPDIDRISADRPLHWLREGFGDLMRSPLSFLLGAIFALLGYGLVNYAWSQPHLALTLTTGFLIVAPFLAVVFYDISREMELHKHYRLTHHLWRIIQTRGTTLGMYAVLLAFVFSVWERTSAILVGLLLKGNVADVSSFLSQALLRGEHLGFIATYALFGLVIAAAVFALSVISLPMMMDRKVDFVTALVTSLYVVKENPVPMLIWAAVIAVLSFIGQATFMIGMIIIFPLLGHATWHAYRDLVEH
jgi:uncharacterized membrane protein